MGSQLKIGALLLIQKKYRVSLADLTSNIHLYHVIYEYDHHFNILKELELSSNKLICPIIHLLNSNSDSTMIPFTDIKDKNIFYCGLLIENEIKWIIIEEKINNINMIFQSNSIEAKILL